MGLTPACPELDLPWRGPGDLALTFDDGPGPSTAVLLDVLLDYGWRATFFVLGAQLAQWPDVAERAVREGHVLGNHTWTHAHPGALNEAALAAEIAATDDAIRQVCRRAGMTAPASVPLRLPYGLVPPAGFSSTVLARSDVTGLAKTPDPRLAVLARLGRTHVGWTAMLDDWQRPAPCPVVLAATMQAHHEAQLARGAPTVFCLHDGSRHGEARPATVETVRQFLAWAGKRA